MLDLNYITVSAYQTCQEKGHKHKKHLQILKPDLENIFIYVMLYFLLYGLKQDYTHVKFVMLQTKIAEIQIVE